MSQPLKDIYTPDFIFSLSAINNMKMPELDWFLKVYNNIEELDKSKPMFSQTTKYKSFPLNFISKRGNKKLNDRVLLIDGLNTYIRIFQNVPVLNDDGIHIGGISGFLLSIGAIIRQFKQIGRASCRERV